jgi:hypothetical protein
VIGVNPGIAGQKLFGETVVARLADIPAEIPVDMVDIFRRSDQVLPRWSKRRWSTCPTCAPSVPSRRASSASISDSVTSRAAHITSR